MASLVGENSFEVFSGVTATEYVVAAVVEDRKIKTFSHLYIKGGESVGEFLDLLNLQYMFTNMDRTVVLILRT